MNLWKRRNGVTISLPPGVRGMAYNENMSFKDACPGSREIRTPYPEEIPCFWCDAIVEIWSDEVETSCKACGKTVSRDMKPTCIEWCPVAEACVGAEKLKRLLRNKKR